MVGSTETRLAGTVVNLCSCSERGLYINAVMLENWGLEYALLGVHAPRSRAMDAASWVDCTYISPNPAPLKLFTEALWLSNMLQVFSRSSVAYRTCLRPQSLAASASASASCKLSPFPHLQMGPTEPRTEQEGWSAICWMALSNNRRGEGPPNPRAVLQ